MSLKEYTSKRNFKKTPEPKAKIKRTRGALRFVVQKHEASRTHFDFRLEIEGAFKSWAVPKGPSLLAHDPRLAVKVEDHPLDYGRFEGIIPPGNYGAGTVMIWDAGTYTERTSKHRAESEEKLKEGLLKGHLTFILEGEKLKGEFALVRVKKKGASANHWLLVKKQDKFSKRMNAFEEDRSVVTRRSMEQIRNQASDKNEIWVRGKKAALQNVHVSKPTINVSTKRVVMKRRSSLAGSSVPLLTHPNKILFPGDGISKKDLFDYYTRISSYLVPHLKGRPQSLHRHPLGIERPGFFQKDMSSFVPRRVRTTRVYSASSKRTLNYVLCEDEWSLLYLVNLGCIELNPWISKLPDLEKPTFAVIDLDPDGNPFSDVVKVALAFHKLLRKLKVPSFCKTSGSTGLHICVPLGGLYEFERARAFAFALCQKVQEEFPKLTSLERLPNRRRGRIYLDYLQNRRGQTLAAPYCVRPKKGALVSTPLQWKEVNSKLKPDRFNLRSIPSRLKKKGDLWKKLHTSKVDLEACMKKLTAHR